MTKRERRVISGLLMLWVFMLAFVVPQYAYAYIDPAATTYIIQAVTAIIVTIGVSFSIVIYRFRMLIAKAWVRLTSGFRAKKKQTETYQTSDEYSSSYKDDSASDLLPEDYEFVTAGSPDAPQKAYGFAFTEGQEYEELAQNYALLQEQEEGLEAEESERKTSSTGKRDGTFKERLVDLFYEKRSFRVRLGLSALVSASLVFTVLVFGPLDLFAASSQDMHFELGDFISGLLLIAFLAFFILTVLLAVLRGRLLDSALSLLMGILVACFVQSVFFNGFIGILTGEAIPWHEHTSGIVINLLVWFLVIALFYIIHFINTKAWQMTIVLACSILVVSQVAGLVSVTDNLTRTKTAEEQSLVLTTEGTLEISSQQNIIVFLLDTLEPTFIDGVRERDPEFFDRLDGFTEYTNNTSRYTFTYPSITYALTGTTNDGEMPGPEHFSVAFDQHLFIDDLVNAGWDSKLYLNRLYDYGTVTQLKGRANNLIDTSSIARGEDWQESFKTALTLAKKLDQLSIFRYAPSGFKAAFWMGSAEMVSDTQVGTYQEYISTYQNEFMRHLTMTGLSAESDNPTFIYYHLTGSHVPYELTSTGYPSLEGETDAITQTEGSFAIIYEYIDQLKALGLYENSCIIILGDHGEWGETRTGLFYKPVGSSNKPLVQSAEPVSEINFVPTVVDQAGVKSTALAADGLTYSETTEKNTPLRDKYCYVRVEEEGFETQHYLYHYEITGHAADPTNWHLVDPMLADVRYLGG